MCLMSKNHFISIDKNQNKFTNTDGLRFPAQMPEGTSYSLMPYERPRGQDYSAIRR